LAASQNYLRNIFGIVGVGTWALATTCNTMVSNLIGQGRRREVMRIIFKICKLSLRYAIGTCILLLSFSHEFCLFIPTTFRLISFAIPSLGVIGWHGDHVAVHSRVQWCGWYRQHPGEPDHGNNLRGQYLVYCYIVIHQLHSPLYIWLGFRIHLLDHAAHMLIIYLKAAGERQNIIGGGMGVGNLGVGIAFSSLGYTITT